MEENQTAPTSEVGAPTKSVGAEVSVPEKFKSIVDAVEKMSVMDLNELVKVFEADKKSEQKWSAIHVHHRRKGDAGSRQPDRGTA